MTTDAMPSSGNDKAGMQKKKSSREVTDRKGTVYTLTGKLGEGGQGIVCKTSLPGVLVKIRKGGSKASQKEWSRHIQWLMRQELDSLKIARPLEIVAKPPKHNGKGYVMELMDGLESLEKGLEKTQQELAENVDKPLTGFLATGGLKRRILLLRELAKKLAGLHSRGYAYGDLSPANIYISESVEHHQVWLIDCDNICVSERRGHGHLHTPGYAAPEIIREESGVNMSSDSWSFAVIALKVLASCDPFESGLVFEDAETEGDDAFEEAQRAASCGEIPWIYDEADDSNEWVSGNGIPLDVVTNPKLRQLFHRCFGDGREIISERPGMGEWLDALEEAHSHLADCFDSEDCGNNFFFNKARECPFCDKVQPGQQHLVMRYYFFNEECLEGESCWIPTGSKQVLSPNQTLSLHLAPMGTDLYRDSPHLCSVELHEDGLFIVPTTEGYIELQRKSDGKSHVIDKRQRLKADSRKGEAFALHLRPVNGKGYTSHPVWKFTW